jgi:hypothetical protein
MKERAPVLADVRLESGLSDSDSKGVTRLAARISEARVEWLSEARASSVQNIDRAMLTESGYEVKGGFGLFPL